MESKKRCFLVSDMDGTMLNKQGKVSRENQRAVAEFLEAGGEFVIASGRAVGSVMRFVGPLGARYGILCNGAILYDFKENVILSHRPMPPEGRRFAEELPGNWPGVSLQVYSTHAMHLLQDNEIIAVKGIPEEYSGLITSREMLPEIWCKMVLSGPPEEMVRLKEAVSAEYPGLNAVLSARHFCELTAKGVSKGAALTELCDRLGVSIEQTVAVGDNENDLSMLKAAGLSMAVANGRSFVREQVDHVLSSHEENPMAEAVRLAKSYFHIPV